MSRFHYFDQLVAARQMELRSMKPGHQARKH